MKTGCWADTDAEARKLGEQTGLDTPVVLALNDEYLVSGGLILRVPSLTFLVFRLGSTYASMKLKGIDGDPHKRWSMWFNSTQREEPYQPLTCPDGFQRWIPPSNRSGHRCCMAVVSSCREMLG